MGASSSSHRLDRSTTRDLPSNLAYSLEQTSKWEDGAAIVADLLKTDISNVPPESLVGVGAPSEEYQWQQRVKQSHTQPSAQTQPSDPGDIVVGAASAHTAPSKSARPLSHSPSPTPPSESSELYATKIDTEGYRHLLHSVDEVLRDSHANEYYAKVPLHDLERAFTHPTSRWSLPPEGVDRSRSASHAFALASLQALAEDQEEYRRHGTGKSEVHHYTSHIDRGKKRTSEMVYENEPQTSKELMAREQPSGGFEQSTPIHLGLARGLDTGVGSESKVASRESTPSVATSGGALSFEALENQRIIVAAKYLFIRHFLEILTKQSEINYKCYIRLNGLKKLFKSDRFIQLPSLQQLRLNKLSDENTHELEKGMISWDRARLTLEWLMRNYSLSAAMFKVNSSILQLKTIERELRTQQPSHGMASSIHASQCDEVSQTLAWLNSRKLKLIMEQQANERDSLSCAMYFLDWSLSGRLEAAELRDLSAHLFVELDTKKRGYITHDTLHECVTQLCAKIDHKYQRLQRLQADNAYLTSLTTDAAMYSREKNIDDTNKVRREMADLEVILKDIYSYFSSKFIAHVFPRVTPSIATTELSARGVPSMEHLFARLAEVEHDATTNVIEHEMHLGRYVSSTMRKQAGIESVAGSPSTSHGGHPTPKERFLGAITRVKEQVHGGGSPREVSHEASAAEPVEQASSKWIDESSLERKTSIAGATAALPVVSTVSHGTTPHTSSALSDVPSKLSEAPSKRDEPASFGERMKEKIGLKQVAKPLPPTPTQSGGVSEAALAQPIPPTPPTSPIPLPTSRQGAASSEKQMSTDPRGTSASFDTSRFEPREVDTTSRSESPRVGVPSEMMQSTASGASVGDAPSVGNQSKVSTEEEEKSGGVLASIEHTAESFAHGVGRIVESAKHRFVPTS